MTADQLIALFTQGFQSFAKISLLILIFLYAAFAAILLRQSQAMNRVINIDVFSPVVFFIVLLHFLATIILFIAVLILL